jgi:hypothetical protein
MTCREIENTLPGYLDDALSEEERRHIEEHLAACPQCREVLADLKRAVGLVQDIADVEPPPWLKQKIMAQVREEADRKKGIIQKLFFPLHIKIPLEAFATVLVAVLAFYMYKASGPEVSRIEPHSAPVYATGKDQVPAKSRQTPASAPPQTLAPRPLASEAAEKDKGLAPVSQPTREDEPRHAEKRIGGEGKLAERKPPPPLIKAEERETRPPKDKEVSDTVGLGRLQAFSHPQQAPLLEEKSKASADAVAQESRKQEAAPVAAQALTAAGPRPIDVTMYVRDTSAAVKAVEDILHEFNAQIIERQVQGGRAVLLAEIKGLYVKAFFEKLKGIGETRGIHALPNVSQGSVIVRTEIIRNN